MTAVPVAPAHGELEGWKEVAQALGVVERTAQRWGQGQAPHGIPIPYTYNTKSLVVVQRQALATWKADLEAWLLLNRGRRRRGQPADESVDILIEDEGEGPVTARRGDAPASRVA